MNQIVLNSFRSFCLFFVLSLILTAVPTGNIYAENNTENCEEAETYKYLRIQNDGTCHARIYWWVATGDVFYTVISPGQHWDVQTSYGHKWRAVNVNNDWQNLLYDDHYMVSSHSNQTWTIAPDYCNAGSCSGEITGFFLNNHDGNALVPLSDGGRLCLSDLSNEISFRTSESGTHESLKYTITGPNVTLSNVENHVTYDSRACQVSPGNYTIKAELFSHDDLGGTKCDEKIISFTIGNDCTDPNPSDCSNPLVYWSLDQCHPGELYSELEPSIATPAGFSNVEASVFYNNGQHSCSAGQSHAAVCHAARINCSWEDDNSNAFRFSVKITPESGKTASLSGFSFYEKAPLAYAWLSGGSGDNDPPAKYGWRLLRDGVEIAQHTDYPTTHEWSLEEFDFQALGIDTEVDVETTFSIEMLGYCRSNGSSGYSLWDVDEIKVYGCADGNGGNNGNCQLAADLGVDQDICNGGLILNPTITGATTCNANDGTAVVENTQACSSGPQDHGCPNNSYVVWLSNSYNHEQYLKNVSLEWIQYPNGTATLKGLVENCSNGDRCFVDVLFTGYTTTPDENPKNNDCFNADPSNWYYYTSFAGTMTEVATGHTMNLSRRGPGFQAGTGANVAESRTNQFGGCAWFDTDGDTYTKGDFNLSFGPLTGGTNGNSAVSYLWNTGATTASIEPTVAGEYCVTVTDCNGCVAEDCVNVNAVNPQGGALTFADGTTETTICVDGTPDPLEVILTGNVGTNQAWVITDTDLNILALPTAPPFDLDGAGAGTCLIWSVSFDDLQGAEVGANAADLIGCFDLSNALTVFRNEAVGGQIAFDGNNAALDTLEICIDGTSDPLNVTLAGNAGANQAWVITDANLNILGLPAAPPFDLNGAGAGTCLIWSVSFADIQGAEVGLNAADLTGCFALSNALTVIRNEAVGGQSLLMATITVTLVWIQ